MSDLLEARYGFRAFTPPDGMEALRPLLDRRVTRRFTARAVTEAELSAVVAGAQSAPSKSDLQQYSIIAIRDEEARARIADAIGTMPWIADAPVLLLFCGDLRRNRLIGEAAGLPNANDSVDSFVNATADAALALGFAVMAADALGLGSCPISYVRNHLDLMRGLCGLPEGVFPLAGLALGWPAARNDTSVRLPPAIVLHHGRYVDAGPSAIAAYDARRPMMKPRYPEVHGPAPDGCRWSENVARQLAVPERPGTRDWLAGQGITLG